MTAGRALTAEHLAADFGPASPAGGAVLAALSRALDDVLGAALDAALDAAPGGGAGPEREAIRRRFEAWAPLYGPAAGAQAALFVAHTLHALLVKLIAAELAAGIARAGSALGEARSGDAGDAALLARLGTELEDGAVFTSAGLPGFVEADAFRWYLDAAALPAHRAALCGALRAVLAQLAHYRLDAPETLRAASAAPRTDVLRDLYQHLVPEALRKRLGEFYTPDWLVEHAVAQLGYSADEWLSRRVLDPTCGSGAFLLAAIAHKRRAAEAAGWDAPRTVQMLADTVWGFDLNPLAVLTARASFVISIADLLGACGGAPLALPVRLADAIDASGPDPAGARTFDAILGNPPWVRWSSLPDGYRERVQPTCARYSIFADTRFHGGSELDIAAVVTYTAADRWLADGGRLVFLLTQTVFQAPSAQGFRRFRIRDEAHLAPLAVDDLKELRVFPGATNKTALAVFAKRAGAGAGTPGYPVAYRVWRGKPRRPGRGPRQQVIDPRLSRAEALAQIDVIPMEATPVSRDIEGAPWAILPPGRYAALAPLLGASSWVSGRKGITTDLNGVYFVDAVDRDEAAGLVKVRTRPAEGRTDIGAAREHWVEAAALYPLAKGAGDLRACRFEPAAPLLAFVPNTGIHRAALDAASVSCGPDARPRTYEFFRAYQPLLEQRSTYRLRMKGAPFFSIYNVGDYTFAPFKVIWAEMSTDFCAAVIADAEVPGYGRRPYVPDHKLYFADFARPEPAHFLCGLLHAAAVKELIEAHHVSTSMGDIFKHVSLPALDERDADHAGLISLVARAHAEPDAAARAGIVEGVRALAGRIIERALS